MNRLKEIFEILRMVGEDSSRTGKEMLLAQYKDNEFMRTLLQLAYDPFKVFYIKKMPDFDRAGFNETGMGKYTSEQYSFDRFGEFKRLCLRLSGRTITGYKALEVVSNFLSTCAEDEADWYCRVLQKDLKIGISDKTINKVFGRDTIPTFNCMLADVVKKPGDMPTRFYVEPKLDGMRVLAYVHGDGDVVLRTRNGRTLDGFEELERKLGQHLPEGFVYDGEIMSKNFNILMSQAFKLGTGKTGCLNIFDIIPVEEFDKGECSLPQLKRKLRLLEIFKGVDNESTPSWSFTPFSSANATILS